MIHPFLCYLFIAISFGISFKLFISGTLSELDYFYLPIVLLIAFYTIHGIVTDRQVYQKRRVLQSTLTATGKFFFWGIILLAVIALYKHHPCYREFAPTTPQFLEHFFYAFAVCGWPYFFLSDRYRHNVGNVLVDNYITFNVLIRCLLRRRFDLFKRRLMTRQVRRMLVSAFLRVHYLPIMVEQVFAGVTGLTFHAKIQEDQAFFQGAGFEMATQPQTLSILVVLIALAWLIDSNNASIGYFWESRFTRTCFREVDPYPIHWIVTLACYYPFIKFMNEYVAQFPDLPDYTARYFTSPEVNAAIDITMVVVLLLYMLSGSSLAFSFSNLSYKKIQTKGPYRFVRHPSITFKIIFFTLAFYRFAPAHTIGWFLCYVFWMGIYVCRAFVEERFLRRFPDYQAYMKQTKYRFIPGVI